MARIHAQSTARLAQLPFRRRLRWQLLLVMLCLAVIPILVVAWATLSRMRAQANLQMVHQLSSVVELKDDQIERWIDDAEIGLDLLLSQPIKDELVALLATGDPAAAARVDNLLHSATVLDHEDRASTFSGWKLYDREGTIVASTDPVEIGMVVRREPYFTPSLDAPYIQAPYYALGNTELSIFITHPLSDEGGQLLGVIAGKLNLDALGGVMLERTGLPSSGETYLVSHENNFLLTPSRFSGVSRFTPHTSQGIERALAGESGSGVYANYFDPPVEVIGVYKWLPQLNAALIAEVELSEAEGIFQQTAQLSLLLIVLTLIVTCAAALFFASWIDRPLSELTATVRRLAGGELGQRVRVTQRNELGVLGEAFNTMAERLAATLDGLEGRVRERTAELEAANGEAQRALAELREALAARDQLSATVRQLSSPVLPVLDEILVVPLIGAIDSERAALLTSDLLSAVERYRARYVLLDVTGVPVVDTLVARVLIEAASAVRLLGADVALVGIRPELAQTIVGLGVDLSALTSYADLQAGLSRFLQRRQGADR